jgi:hypothetical protein
MYNPEKDIQIIYELRKSGMKSTYNNEPFLKKWVIKAINLLLIGGMVTAIVNFLMNIYGK